MILKILSIMHNVLLLYVHICTKQLLNNSTFQLNMFMTKLSVLVFVLSYDSSYCNAFESFKLIVHGKFWHVVSLFITALVLYYPLIYLWSGSKTNQKKQQNIWKEIMMWYRFHPWVICIQTSLLNNQKIRLNISLKCSVLTLQCVSVFPTLISFTQLTVMVVVVFGFYY